MTWKGADLHAVSYMTGQIILLILHDEHCEQKIADFRWAILAGLIDGRWPYK
jgi:hypothetical protein